MIMGKADFFISHASEDNETFVKSLADSLILNGALVFYDEYSLKLGDSLTDSINNGIRNANHGIIVLSKYFFEKRWTNAELQALFNKSLRENFKLLIIYHQVDHSEVSKQYPLLADIKAIDSSVGIEKITEELFKSIDKKTALAYLKHDFDRKSDEIKKGFSIGMYIGFPRFGDPRFNKVLFDLGTKGKINSRLRLILYYNVRLYFELTDSDFHKISISTDVSGWNIGEQHFVFVNLDIENKSMYMLVDDKVVDQMDVKTLTIDTSFLQTATGIIGNSLELTDPCPFFIGSHSIGKSMSIDLAKRYYDIMIDYIRNVKNSD